jgi:hypothetical protein
MREEEGRRVTLDVERLAQALTNVYDVPPRDPATYRDVAAAIADAYALTTAVEPATTESYRHETHVCRECAAEITIPYVHRVAEPVNRDGT